MVHVLPRKIKQNAYPQKSKRIIFFTHTLGAGGAERQLLYLISGLDRTLFEIKILTIYDDVNQKSHFREDIDSLGIEVHTLTHGSGLTGRVYAIAKYVKLMWQWRPHVVQGILHYSNLIARVARPFCPPHRLVTCIHAEYSDRQLRSERLTQWLSDRTIVVSPHLTTRMHERAQTPLHKILVIPNATLIEQFKHPLITDLREKLFPNATFVALMVARIDIRKDHKTLLEALKILKEQGHQMPQVMLLGEVTDHVLQEELKTLIKEFGLTDTVLQQTEVKDVSSYYHAADVTLLTSRTEAFPVVLLESLAAGKPVIVSEAANQVQLIEHNVTGWVFATGDASQLAQCLQMAAQTVDRQREIMGGCARKVADQYGVTTMVDRYTELFDSLT